MHGSNLLSVGVGTTTVPQTVVVGGGVLENKNNEVASYHLFTFSKINFLVVTRARKAFNYFKRGASVVWFPYVDFLFLFSISFLNIPVLRSFG